MANGRKLKPGELNLTGDYLVSLEEKRARLKNVFRQTVCPPARPDLDDWSDEHRRLPKATSSEPGRWKTSRFPFLRKIMKSLSPTSIAREICVKKGAQLGFTELCINWMLYVPAVCPGPMMYVQKTKDAAEDFSTQKLAPNIEECDKVANILGPLKPKRLSNEVLNKGFPGGFIVMGGANSAVFLRSKSIAYAMADEEDSFSENTIGSDGSSIGMIRKRLANFPLGKFFRLSTPKFTESSTITAGYLAGSQEELYVPCPLCNPKAHKGGTFFTIKWGNIKYNKKYDLSDLPTDIYLECENCGGHIREHHKTFMLDHGRWLSEKGSPGEPYEVDDVEKPSYNISSLYSPLGFFSWRDAVAEWFEYKKTKNKALLQVFINQTLGETYDAMGQDISSSWLYNRREEYHAKVPLGVLCLTAGVDVQKDRLEVEIVGWGLNNQSWSIDFLVLWGNTKFLTDEYGQKSVWSLLDEYLNTRYTDELGKEFYIECMAIDAQYNTDTVNKYCKLREHLRVFPIHGQEGWGKGFIKRPKRRHEEYGTWNFTLFVDELKEKTYNLLMVDQPGPGFCHFPNYDHYNEQHFKQMTAETKKVIHTGHQPKIKWVLPSGARNEQLDCRNYATAALLILAPNLLARAENLKESMDANVAGCVGSENSSDHIKQAARALDNNLRQLKNLPVKRKKKNPIKKKNTKGVW